MNILTLFCEIDDFFLTYEKWMATHCLPQETAPPETRGRRRSLPERSDDAPYRLSSKWVSDV